MCWLPGPQARRPPPSLLLLKAFGPGLPAGKFKGKRELQQNVDEAPGTCPSVSAPQDMTGDLGSWCAFHRFLRRAAHHAVSLGLGQTFKVRQVPQRSWPPCHPCRRTREMDELSWTSGCLCLLEIKDFLSAQISFRSGLINPLTQANQL